MCHSVSDHCSYDHEENRERFSDKEIDTARQIMASDALPAVFGVALSVSCPDGSYPDEIEALIEHIKNKGLRSDSIFRRSPNAEALARLRDDMNKRMTRGACLFISHITCRRVHQL